MGHLQLIDLDLPRRAGSVDDIGTALDTLGVEGLLVSFGRSYHFYGSHIDYWDRYVEFLARASLLSPLVDSRWALRQIIAGRGARRVSTNTEREVHTPTPVA